jgi:hypothetical protein
MSNDNDLTKLISTMDSMQKIFQNCAAIQATVLQPIQALHQTFVNSINAIAGISNRIQRTYEEVYKPISDTIADVIAHLQIPSLSEDDKKNIIQSFEKWGSYGWTILPSGPAFLFNDCPDEIKDANRIALSFCRKDDTTDLFSELISIRGSKKTDLNEAIYCFENKKWKACAMIMFSLIDAKLIRGQKKDTKKRRPSGSRAAEKLFETVNNEQNLENTLYILCAWQNVLSCIRTVFSDGNDFKEQPTVINRNFLDHGMMSKPVRRKDCIQLFLLYYNLLILLDMDI